MIHARRGKPCERIDLSIRKNRKVVARASVIIIPNELHKRPSGQRIPYALLEDVFVEKRYRGKGLATDLIRHAIETAKKKGCYKLIAVVNDAEPHLKALYENMGLKKNNSEFRIDLTDPSQ